MKKLRVVLVCIIVLFALPTLVSCDADNDLIIEQNDEIQIQQDFQASEPANSGGGDDDDEEDGQ